MRDCPKIKYNAVVQIDEATVRLGNVFFISFRHFALIQQSKATCFFFVFCLFHCLGVDVFIQTRSCEQDVRPSLKIRLKDGGGEAEQREHEELHPGESCEDIF